MEDKEQEQKILDVSRKLAALHDSTVGTKSTIYKVKNNDQLLILKGDDKTVQEIATLIENEIDQSGVTRFGEKPTFNVDILSEPSNKIQLSMLVNKYDKRHDIADIVWDMIVKTGSEGVHYESGQFDSEKNTPAIAITGFGKNTDLERVKETLEQFFGDKEPAVIKYQKDDARTYIYTEDDEKKEQKGAELILLDSQFFSKQQNLIMLGVANTSIPDINMGRNI